MSGKSFKIKLGLIVNYGRMRALSFLFLFFFYGTESKCERYAFVRVQKIGIEKVISHLVVRSLGIWVNGTSGGGRLSILLRTCEKFVVTSWGFWYFA